MKERAKEQRKCDQRKITEIWEEGGWKKYELHVSYVEMMNMDDCSVHAPHFVENNNETTEEGRLINYILYFLQLSQLKYLFETSIHSLF